jgi:phosphoribosylaminoimidazole carboxylase PurE protein
MGSKSDAAVMQGCLDALNELGIPHETAVLSAHRTPEKVREFALAARDRGIEVIIAGAGGSAALPGAIKAYTPLPVIGVPIDSSALKGIDALLAMAQMPPGVPVATVAVGAWGARNAALLAAEILALSHADIRRAYDDYRRRPRVRLPPPERAGALMPHVHAGRDLPQDRLSVSGAEKLRGLTDDRSATHQPSPPPMR